jgi:hypothetical protein
VKSCITSAWVRRPSFRMAALRVVETEDVETPSEAVDEGPSSRNEPLPQVEGLVLVRPGLASRAIDGLGREAERFASVWALGPFRCVGYGA